MRDEGVQPIDLVAVMERFDGDLPFFRELLHDFLTAIPSQVRLIEEAVVRGDGAQVRQIAHGIRGAAGNLGAGPVSALAHAIEGLGTGLDRDGATGHLETLRYEIARIERYAEALK